MFENALRASIPIIGVTTDDLINAPEVLRWLAKKTPAVFPTNQSYKLSSGVIYYTQDVDVVTPKVYHSLMETDTTLVVINAEKKNTLVFDAGTLPTPDIFIKNYLKDFAGDQLESIFQALKGLSLKTASEIIQLTMVRTGAINCKDIADTRTLLRGPVSGLEQIDITYDFYSMPKRLEEWLEENTDYFFDDSLPIKMRPRGLMFDGPPGVGKSMAAKAIAKRWNLPLFRLDIGGLLDKYIGNSERKLADLLTEVSRQEPCVLLLDECEKLFSGDIEGTTKRMLSQLLWWLAEHRSRVVTVGTTNNLTAIPEEFYRPGRFDEVIRVVGLNREEAKKFANLTYRTIFKAKLPVGRESIINSTLDYMTADNKLVAHSLVEETVYRLVKANHWLKKTS